MSRSRRAALLACALAGAAPVGAPAQYLLPAGGAGPSLHLEVTKPFVSSYGPFEGVGIATSMWDLSVVLPMSGGPTLFARTGLTYAYMADVPHSMTIAKPRLGAMVGGVHESAEAHVDLPLGSEHGDDYATGIAIFSDYEELERFETDVWSVGASATSEWESGTPNAFFGVRAGATILSPDERTDAYGHLGIFAHAPSADTRFRFDVSMSFLASRSGLGFDQRSTFFAALEIARPDSRLAPAFFVRAPVDKSLDGSVALVMGLRLRMGG